MAADARVTLAKYKKEFEPLIDEFFSEVSDEFEDLTPAALQCLEIIEEFTNRGGKRLRPAFMYYGYVLSGGTEREEIMRCSVAIEIIHSYLLIEDDFMDRADIRRNKPTVHKIYEKLHEENLSKSENTHFSASMGLTAAIVANHLAQYALARAPFPDSSIRKVMRRINKLLVFTGFGQLHDLLSEVDPGMTEDDAMRINLWKTAMYTYDMPLQAGGILAGASDDDLKLLSSYALPAGTAFQIQDDILGIFGTEEKLGKEVGTDIMEGKRTIPVLKALEKGTPEQRNLIERNLGNQDLTDAELAEIKSVIIDTGGYDYTKKLAEKYVREALEALESMKHLDSEGVSFLEGIAEYMIDRDI